MRTCYEAGMADHDHVATLAQRVEPGSKLRRMWELKGGVSAQVTAFELERADGRVEQLVVRRHGARDLARNPRIAADEFRLLELLRAAGGPAPAPRYLDADGDVFGTPCLVVDYIEGEPATGREPDLVPQLATVLARIHGVGTTADVSFLRELALPGLSERNAPALLHGDFWPGNTLWKHGRLVAVVDWEGAAVGDPLADLANTRLELLWALGTEAMEEFTHEYGSVVPAVDFADLPDWDRWAGLRVEPRIAEWGLDADNEQTMRTQLDWFLGRAS
jgi:aminoglycoside phosphotransferase (APT) family kinase protein